MLRSADAASLPSALIHEGKRSLLNFFGGALAVAGDPAVWIAIETMQTGAGTGAATVIGHAERLDPEERTETEALVRGHRTKQQNIHARGGNM